MATAPNDIISGTAIPALYTFISNSTNEIRPTKNAVNANSDFFSMALTIDVLHIDKKNNTKFSFEVGSIENPVINKHASDILEGTLKAFNVRRLKYLNTQVLENR